MTDAPPSSTGHRGLDALLKRPLVEAIWRRRTHRVSQGSTVLAGTMSYESRMSASPCRILKRRC